MTKEVEIRLSKLNRNKSKKIAQFIFSLVIIQKLVFFTHKISFVFLVDLIRLHLKYYLGYHCLLFLMKH